MCTHNLCFEQKYEKKKKQPKILIFTAVKNRCMLHGRVFVMKWGIFWDGIKVIKRYNFEYHMFLINVSTLYQDHLGGVILIDSHNILFYGEINPLEC